MLRLLILYVISTWVSFLRRAYKLSILPGSSQSIFTIMDGNALGFTRDSYLVQPEVSVYKYVPQILESILMLLLHPESASFSS